MCPTSTRTAGPTPIRDKGYPEVFNPGNYNSRVAIAVADTMKALGAKRVVAFCENTDYGVGLAKLLGDQIKERAPGIEYKYETLDRAGKDFLPALLPLKANPPDVVVEIMLPPAAYILLNQLNEQGIAPPPKTWIYDASGIADYPDFWQNVSDAAKSHAGVRPLSSQDGDCPSSARRWPTPTRPRPRTSRTGCCSRRPTACSSSPKAIKSGEARAEPDAVIKAMEDLKWTGTRGEITFSKEKGGYKYHQWLDIPYVTFQVTAVKQSIADTKLVQDPGKPLDISR